MHHPHTSRRILFVLFAGLWVFVLLSLGSFHATDWPSHAVYPYTHVANLCGNAGAAVAYWTFFVLGQGVFPVLFFSGICIALWLFGNRVSDVWLRTVGIALLSVAFASAVHLIRPGAANALPEGTGGLIGIGASEFLRHHCNALVTSLILACAFLVGLLLAADDLVVRVPGFVGSAISTMRERSPQVKFNFPQLPKLPSLPRFVTRDAIIEEEVLIAKKPASRAVKASVIATNSKLRDEEDEEIETSPEIPKREMVKVAPAPVPPPAKTQARVVTPRVADEDVQLDYDNDDPAPVIAAAHFNDHEDAPPSEPAVIPPVEEQAVPVPAPVARAPIVVKLPSHLKPRNVSPPPAIKELGEYQLPGWDCLAEAEHGYAESQESFVRQKAAELEQALTDFQIEAHVTAIDTGPVITMYELALSPGVKVSTISALSNDIQRALKAETIRIVAPIPGKATVGIEVPNEQKEKVRLKELMQLTPPELTREGGIPIFLGKDASGEPLIADLTKMPHGLIAGTTGSGKSVCINTIIMSIMYLQRPDRVKLILVDPKVVEMAPFRDIPHLMCPVITQADRATNVLEWACNKMDERYEFLAEAGVRNIKDYNKMTQEELVERFMPSSPEEEAKIPKKLPYVVIIIDELADLMMTSTSKECESFIVRIAQKARAVGIHLVLATQRPQATVVTGLIKANMPCKMAFRVSSKMDSRIVLDMNGAEVLLGQGDMLYLAPGASKPVRGQGTYIDDKEIRDSVKMVKSLADAQYEPELVQIKSVGTVDDEASKDELFDAAVRVVLETKRGSVSLLQRRLTIGYARSSRLIEAMAAAGIVGSYKGSQAREAQITVEEWDAMQSAQQTDAESGMSV